MNNPFLWGGRNYLGLFGVLSSLVLYFSLAWFFSFTSAGATTNAWLAKYGATAVIGLMALGFLIYAAWPKKVPA